MESNDELKRDNLKALRDQKIAEHTKIVETIRGIEEQMSQLLQQKNGLLNKGVELQGAINVLGEVLGA